MYLVVRHELTQLKHALDQENMSLAAELLRFDAFDNPNDTCQEVYDGHQVSLRRYNVGEAND